MLENHVDLIFIMIFTIVIGGFFGGIYGFFLANPLARLSFVRASILVPVFMVIILAGGYMVHANMFDILIILVFGILGYFMKIYGYSRASFLIGFVLAFIVERNLNLSIRLYGAEFIFEPITFGILMIIVLTLGYNIWIIVRDYLNKKGRA